MTYLMKGNLQMNNDKIYAAWNKYRDIERHAIGNTCYLEHIKAFREAVDNIRPVIDYTILETDYTILETHEINLQNTQYDSVKRIIKYCYEFIPYLSIDNNDIKDCTIALDKINSFFQTKQINSGDLCIVAEPVFEYKTKDSGDVSESVSIDKRNNGSTPTIKIPLETGLTLIGLLLSFITIILDVYFHEIDSIENNEPKTEININIEEQNIEIREVEDLINSGEYLQKIMEQIRENHPELFKDI